MKVDEARQVINTFGPCTTLYECTTPEELAKENPEETPAQVAWFEYDLETVRVDRQQGATENDKEIQELAEFLSELKQRVQQAYGPKEQ